MTTGHTIVNWLWVAGTAAWLAWAGAGACGWL